MPRERRAHVGRVLRGNCRSIERLQRLQAVPYARWQTRSHQEQEIGQGLRSMGSKIVSASIAILFGPALARAFRPKTRSCDEGRRMSTRCISPRASIPRAKTQRS